MSEISCERVRMAAMAAADGHAAGLPSDQMNAHLVSCAECRHDLEGLRSLSLLLDRQRRREQSGDLWPLVAARLPATTGSRGVPTARAAFILLGLTLLGYRLFEMLPEHSPGLYFKIVPVLLVTTVFFYLRENPFRIEAELRMEGAGK